MKKNRLLALFLALSIIMLGIGVIPVVSASAQEREYIGVQDPESLIWDIEPGETISVKIPVKALVGYTYKVQAELHAAQEDAPFDFGTPELTTDLVSDNVSYISTTDVTYINARVRAKENAKIGKYPVEIHLTFQEPGLSDEGSPMVEQTLNMRLHVTKEKSDPQPDVIDISYNEDAAAIGNGFEVTLTVQNTGEIKALGTTMKLDYGDSQIIAGYSANLIKVGDLNPGQNKTIKVKVRALPTATEGIKTLTAAFKCKDPEGKSYEASSNIYLNIKKVSTAESHDAKLIVTSDSINNEVNAGGHISLKGMVKNIGKKMAKDVEISISKGVGAETGLILDLESPVITMSDIQANKSSEFSLPLMATKSAAGGLVELSVQVSYTDSEGNIKSMVSPFYVTVVTAEEVKGKSDIIISNVSQSPDSPKVKDKITMSFDVENRGNEAATNITVGGQQLANSGLEPISSQSLVKVGTLKAGEKKRVSLDFRVGLNAVEGLNTLTLGCSYDDSVGTTQTTTTEVYVLNVINDSNSKPKLIISRFSKDEDELKAGSTFHFTYVLKNTHISKAAKNIKVTISQQDNVFSTTEGTSSLYIDRIGPGEESENTIELRVKPDVTTGSYELSLDVEYEYDDMSKADEEAGGVKESNKLKLQAVENLRPSVQNLAVGNYGDMAFVGQSSTMSFNFINMGKSPLNNVRFSLEGDFKLETGDSFYFGTISPGSPEYVEMMVIPSVAGPCSGTLIMTFEDSTGAEVQSKHEFSDIMVADQSTMDQINDGFNMGNDPMVPGFNEGGEVQEKTIMPVWVFVLIQVVILVGAILVTRIIVITVYKKKHRDDDEDL